MRRYSGLECKKQNKRKRKKEDNEAKRKTRGENERNEAIKRNQKKKRGIYLSTKKKKKKQASKQTHSSPVPFQTPCKIIKAGLSPFFSKAETTLSPLNGGLSAISSSFSFFLRLLPLNGRSYCGGTCYTFTRIRVLFWSFFFVVTVHCFQCTPICGIVINKGGKRAAIHRSLMQIIKSMNGPMQMRKTPHISAAGH